LVAVQHLLILLWPEWHLLKAKTIAFLNKFVSGPCHTRAGGYPEQRSTMRVSPCITWIAACAGIEYI